MSLIQELKRPFPLDVVHWRVGAVNKANQKAIGLAYIDARDAMKRLDDVVGAENWQCRYPLADSGLLICEIGINVGGEWVWKANGAGDTQVEAEKGKASDAFKRAAVLWGVGRYLYYLPNIWVAVEPYGKSYRFARGAIDELIKEMPVWAKP